MVNNGQQPCYLFILPLFIFIIIQKMIFIADSKKKNDNLTQKSQKSKCPSFLLKMSRKSNQSDQHPRNQFLEIDPNIQHKPLLKVSKSKSHKCLRLHSHSKNQITKSLGSSMSSINMMAHKNNQNKLISSLAIGMSASQESKTSQEINDQILNQSYQDDEGETLKININRTAQKNIEIIEEKGSLSFKGKSFKRYKSITKNLSPGKKQSISGRKTNSVKNSPRSLSNRSAASSLGKGDEIQNFELMDLLGRGSTAKVYLARHKPTGSLYALKIFNKQSIKKNNIEQSILRQIKIGLKIKDPQIMNLYHVFDDQKNIYFVMEYLTNGTLHEFWKTNGICPEKTAAIILSDVCHAIKVLHQHDIMHRDIKLENIMVQFGVAKLGDFGCSIESNFMRKSYIGSPGYLSPEQLSNHYYNKKIDMWSLGILAHEILLGKSPYEKDVYQILIKKNENHILPPIKFSNNCSLSEAAKDFITKLLDHRIDKRMSAQAALKHAFIVENVKQTKHIPYNVI